MRTKKNGKPTTTFIIVGIICIAVAIFLMRSNQGEFLKGEAVISRIEVVDSVRHGKVEHEVYVNYTIDGTEYKDVRYDTYHVGMSVGDTVKMEYDVADPAHIRSEGAKFMPYIFLAAGFGLVAAGVVSIKDSGKRAETNGRDPFAGV